MIGVLSRSSRLRRDGKRHLEQNVLGTNEEILTAVDRIPIRESGEPLVPVQEVCPNVDAGSSPVLLRRSAALRLRASQEWLEEHHPGWRLRVGDGYRSPEHQTRLFRKACWVARLLHPFWKAKRIRELANRYVADPDAAPPPPHTTGGALDVGLLTPEGKRAGMGPFRLAATRMDYLHLSPQARQHRQILRGAMESGGFVNYAEEWWHWSYGDSEWAAQTGQAAALYGQVPPP
jgi:zinc D-Ala-D-Ala dipeptidase